MQRADGYRLKRPADIAVSAAALVVLSPVLAAIGVAILVTDGRPVLFRQRRPGRGGRPFTLLKFRTMREVREAEDRWTTDSVRVTRVGRVLRRTSLDELPELLNVIKGDMSLVGPRPLLEEYLPKYSRVHSRRHDLRPGITGLAQISGRRALTLGQRLDLDVEYIHRCGPLLDARILLATLREPFRRGDNPVQSLDEIDDVAFHTHGADPATEQGRPRWESGSFFPAVPTSTVPLPWLPKQHRLLATGRQAILSAFRQGSRTRGWQRLVVPEYFCPPVRDALGAHIPIGTYPCDPFRGSVAHSFAPDDAVLAMSYFGVRPDLPVGTNPENVILDATHDPLATWLADFSCAYVIASLRKTLPVPDGAVLWSPTGAALPAAESFGRGMACVDGLLDAMRAKAEYLGTGLGADKEFIPTFAVAQAALEGATDAHRISSWSADALTRMPVHAWRDDRIDNIARLEQALGDLPQVHPWPNTFGLILVLADRSTRDAVRARLTAENLYSAILWQPPEPSAGTIGWDFGRRMLHIHADFRLRNPDLAQVGSIIRNAVVDTERTSREP